MKRQKIICLIGASNATKDEQEFAYQTGKLVAQKGYILCCGGKGGVMSAACQAAYEQGGLTIGLLPKDDGSDDNGFLSIRIPTGIGHARNKMVADTADAIIAIGGSYGTLSEIAYARIQNKMV
ncbi:MAG: TIGR00725 family protein, partial [Chloroflexi bacterium]|nr:TIGR00725 family protein [Chloroflexota bacterium]